LCWALGRRWLHGHDDPAALNERGARGTMVDLHCHILPGIDDGAKTMEDSLAMAEMAIADGITHVVATPHSSENYVFDYPRIRELRDALQEKVGDRLQLATGCDFHVSPENVDRLKHDPARYCINQKDYLLVEFNEFSIPPWMDQALHELQLAGIRPVVTHPERNRILRARPERLVQWARLGCYVQVTAGSVTGTFGSGAQEDALAWIALGIIHFVSSDAHNITTRPQRLQPAYDVVREKFGREKAEALFVENPLAAFEGLALPHVPVIAEDAERPQRKRFFFF
jgi:protein-tyrosine phosphatase